MINDRRTLSPQSETARLNAPVPQQNDPSRVKSDSTNMRKSVADSATMVRIRTAGDPNKVKG